MSDKPIEVTNESEFIAQAQLLAAAIPYTVITQGNLDRRLFQTAANAVIGRLLAAHPDAPRNPRTYNDFPYEVRGKIKALMKAFDRVLISGQPFTAYIHTSPDGVKTVSELAMVSSDGFTFYSGINAIACKCKGSTHHNVCYHRWTWLILNDYVILLKAHEDIANTYKALGMSFEIKMFDRDDEEDFVDAMLHQEPVNKRGF